VSFIAFVSGANLAFFLGDWSHHDLDWLSWGSLIVGLICFGVFIQEART
jgi:hypothetical protein